MHYTFSSAIINFLIAISTSATILPALHQRKFDVDASPSTIKTAVSLRFINIISKLYLI